MKIYTFVITICIFSVGWTVPAAAQSDWNILAKDSLSISLNNLKRSAQQMRQRNQWLRAEISSLETRIDGSRQPVESVQRPNSVGRQAALKPVGANGVQIPAVTSSAQQRAAAEEQRLLSEIAMVDKELQQLMAALQSDVSRSDHPILDGDDHETKVRLIETNVQQMNRQLENLTRQNASALKEYNQLQEKNLGLKKNKAVLTGALQLADQEYDRLVQELKSFEAQQKQLIQEATSAVDELETEIRSLESVLKKVDMRLTGKQRKLEITDQEIETLMENRHFIKAENTSLKDKFFRLQEDWKEIKKSAKK